MSKQRIKVIGENEFNEREWLRREVLWASLMSPYPEQMQGWYNGLEVAHHLGNSSRQKVYAEFDNDTQSQSQAFFNQGKVLGGIISSSIIFRGRIKTDDLQQLYNNDGMPLQQTLELQTQNIDMALGNIAVNGALLPEGDISAYAAAERMAMLANSLENAMLKKMCLVRAAKIMTGLAIDEITNWRLMAAQNKADTQPALIIPNGGTPRSVGPRVEKLQPIFQEILQSDHFKSL
jgi:hypothetical protein